MLQLLFETFVNNLNFKGFSITQSKFGLLRYKYIHKKVLCINIFESIYYLKFLLKIDKMYLIREHNFLKILSKNKFNLRLYLFKILGKNRQNKFN